MAWFEVRETLLGLIGFCRLNSFLPRRIESILRNINYYTSNSAPPHREICILSKNDVIESYGVGEPSGLWHLLFGCPLPGFLRMPSTLFPLHLRGVAYFAIRMFWRVRQVIVTFDFPRWFALVWRCYRHLFIIERCVQMLWAFFRGR